VVANYRNLGWPSTNADYSLLDHQDLLNQFSINPFNQNYGS